MKIMKKICAGVFAFALTLSAFGCGNTKANGGSSVKSSAQESIQLSESETESVQEPDEPELPESAKNPANLLQALYLGCPKEETEARLQRYGFYYKSTRNAEGEDSYGADVYWFNGTPTQICLTDKYYDDSLMPPFIEVSYNDDGLLCCYVLDLFTAIPYDEYSNTLRDESLATIIYLWGSILEDIYGQGRTEEKPSNLLKYYQTCWEDDAGTVQIELRGGFASSQSNYAGITSGSTQKSQPLMQIPRIK